MKASIRITVNQKEYHLEIESRATLLDVLRDNLKLKSVHRSYEEGECGACTVLLDNEPVYSCLTLAVQADGKKITTLEGLIKDGRPYPLIRIFTEHHAIQCGYCSPGMILTAYSLVNNNESLDQRKIRKGLEGNICRCTGYVNIVKAIETAVESRASGDWW